MAPVLINLRTMKRQAPLDIYAVQATCKRARTCKQQVEEARDLVAIGRKMSKLHKMRESVQRIHGVFERAFSEMKWLAPNRMKDSFAEAVLLNKDQWENKIKGRKPITHEKA